MENNCTEHRRCSLSQAFKQAWRANFSREFWIGLGLWTLLAVAVWSVKYAFMFGAEVGYTAVAVWIWAVIIFSKGKPKDTNIDKLWDLFISYGLWVALILSLWLAGKLTLMFAPFGLTALPFYLTVLCGLAAFIIVFLVTSVACAIYCVCTKDYGHSVSYLVYVAKWLTVFALLSLATWAFWNFVIPFVF